MIATNTGWRILALAAFGAALAGCDSIKDVRSEPSTALPPETVVLKGTVDGVGSKRAVTLASNGKVIAVLAPPPAATNEELNGITPFVIGTFPAGETYNVQVTQSPPGKNCIVVSGGSGTFSANVETDVKVQCNPDDTTPRYSVTVTLNSAFSNAQGAQVALATEDRVYRINPAPGAPNVKFENVLINPDPTNNPQIADFTYSVTASTTAGGTVNKCPVVNPTGTNKAADVTDVAVNACSFTIGGTVSYSTPVGGTAPVTPPAGLVLELRNVAEDSVRTQAYSGAWGGSFTFSDGGTPVQFVSNRSAIYYVAVNTHPADMHCVVVNPTAILYAPTLTSNPANITSPSVQCRALPAANKQLRGVYRHTTSIWQRRSTTPVQTVTYDAFDFSKQNTASSNMIAFFENGTYIYGTHANTAQIEHGFYDYDPVAATLRFTLNADTSVGTTFPGNFSPAPANSPATVPTTTNGLSVVPGAAVVGGARQALLENVDVSTPGVISGTFRGSQSVTATPAGLVTTGSTDPASAIAASTEPNATLGWVLEAPRSITGQMTGPWLAQDSRRLWVFDRETYYGTHVGVVGWYTMNDACFTMPDLTASSSLYTRRPSINGCYPWPRPRVPNTDPVFNLTGLVESVDLKVPQYIPTTSVSTAGGAVDVGTLPEYMARIPGGAQAVDGRAPSPIAFHIAPAAQFYDAAPPEYFPTAPTNWCTTEILGIRATLNAVPIHKPVYFCRFVP